MNSEELQAALDAQRESDNRELSTYRERALQKQAMTLIKAVDRLKKNTSFQRVKEFMLRFGHPVYEEPRLIEDQAWEAMRIELIREELCELMDALGYKDTANQIRAVYINPDEEYERDLVAAADALGDLEYVVNGAAIGMGIPLPEVVAEIHRSNMTKLGPDGRPIYREDGKILKGEDYEPPNLERVLYPDEK